MQKAGWIPAWVTKILHDAWPKKKKKKKQRVVRQLGFKFTGAFQVAFHIPYFSRRIILLLSELGGSLLL